MIGAAGKAQLPEAPAPAASAQVEPWAAPDFSVDPKTLYEAASAVAVPDGANVVEFVEDESYTFDDAGRMNHVGHIIYKVLTQKGAEGWDSLSVGWEPWHEARPVIRARVIAPDFTVHELDPNTMTEAPARGGDYKIYSDGKRLHAPFPAIAPGVVVEEEYTETETAPLFAPGRVGRVELGQEDVMVAHSRVVFDAPATLPLRTELLLLPDLKPVRTEADGRVTLTFDMGPIEGVDSREPYLPPDAVHFPIIAFSTGASWQSIAAAYGKIVDDFSGSAGGEGSGGPADCRQEDCCGEGSGDCGLSRPRGAIHGHRIWRSGDCAARSGRNPGQEIRRLQRQGDAAGGDAAGGGNSGQRGAAQCRIADGCTRRSAGHGHVRPRHRLCAGEESASGSTPPTATRNWGRFRWATRGALR